MPPRRSSRAPSASVEPQPTGTQPNKRKRGATVEHDTEQEPSAKPASKARRPSSTRGSVLPAVDARKASRGKAPLPEVPESGNEEEIDSAPPSKKPRPSAEHEQDSSRMEEDEEVEQPPARIGKRAPSVRRESARPPSRRASRRKTPTASTSRISAGSTSSAIPEEPEVDEEDQEAPQPKPRRGAFKGKAKQMVAEDDDASVAEQSDGDDDEDVKPATRGKDRKGKAPARKVSGPKAPKPAPRQLTPEDSDAAEDSDDLLPPPTQPSPAKQRPPPPPEEEEEEEKSLFDPPPAASQPSVKPPVVLEEPQGPKARLVIHKITLVNFKSYAGKQVIGPFHKSFSAIVGPNGSGKSNTIDALLFVFGYRASKMRQGKISELIHNSANHPNLKECSVAIHFRQIIDTPGSETFQVVPKSDLVVARYAYKNNSSKYTVNKRSTTFSEVQELLKGLGIDLDHNRFLILQGEVESIAQMKPKASNEHEEGLLEYLEDIIGTSQYKAPIEEASAETDRLNEERQVKLNRLRHVESEKAALEARKKEAEAYLRLKNDHARALSRQYQYAIYVLFENETRFQKDIARAEKTLAAEREKNKDNLEGLEEKRKLYADREETYEVVRDAAAKVTKEMADYEKQEISLQEKRKHANSKANKLKKLLTEDNKALKSAQRTIEESKDKIKSEKAKLEEHEQSLEQEEAILEEIQESLKDKTQGINEQIQSKQRELEPWTAKVNQKQSDIDVAASERAALKKKAADLQQQTEEAGQIYQALKEEYEAKNREQQELRTEKAKLQRDVQNAERRVKDARDNYQTWRAKSATTRGKVDEAKANQSENRSRNHVLDSLTRLRDAGNNDGFYGRLGSLGTIPDKYDVAVSTACGGTLSNMVVDHVHQAQHCIEYLRKNNVGRAYFLVLDKMPRKSMEKFQTPEGVPRLFDLVKFKDEKFAPAFYKAMGDTLVAKDIDQANRIAFQGSRRFRVVTLDGNLIEISGSMSGGGGQVSRGAMSSKLPSDGISAQAMQQLEKDNEQASQMLQRATVELQAAEAELEGLKKRDPEIELQFQKLGMEVETIKRRIVEAEKRVKDLQAQNKPDAGDLARISKLDKDIAAATKALEQLTEKTDSIGADIKALEKRIIEIGGSKLLTQKSKVDGIRTYIAICSDEITKAEVARDKAKKDIAKYEASIETNQIVFAEAEGDVEALDEALEKLTAALDQQRARVEEAQLAAENQKEDLERLKEEVDELEEAVKEFVAFETKINRDIAEKKKELAKIEGETDGYQNLHDNLVLEPIDDDDEDEGDDDEAKEKENEKTDNATTPEGDEHPVKHEDEGDEEASESPPPTAAKDRGFEVLTKPQLAALREDELLADAEFIDEQLKKMTPDLSVLTEYKQREQEFLNRAKDLDEVTAQRDAQKQKHDDLCKQRHKEFMAGFNLISLKLKEMYQMITLGGNAELELVDSMDPFAEGIIFSVMPPKKSWKNISNLSGGEKTLSSLALVFALHVFKPTPLYFMDEIDAALDFRNVSIVANYIKDRTKNAQFIIISLRNDMFELSHRLIGIYKTSNQTRSIAIDNHALHDAIPKVVPLMPTQPSATTNGAPAEDQSFAEA